MKTINMRNNRHNVCISINNNDNYYRFNYRFQRMLFTSVYWNISDRMSDKES